MSEQSVLQSPLIRSAEQAGAQTIEHCPCSTRSYLTTKGVPSDYESKIGSLGQDETQPVNVSVTLKLAPLVIGCQLNSPQVSSSARYISGARRGITIASEFVLPGRMNYISMAPTRSTSA